MVPHSVGHVSGTTNVAMLNVEYWSVESGMGGSMSRVVEFEYD